MESFTSLKRIFKKKIIFLKSDQKGEGEKGVIIAKGTQVNYADENLKKP